MNRSAPFLLIDISKLNRMAKLRISAILSFAGRAVLPLWGKTVFYLHDKEEQTG